LWSSAQNMIVAGATAFVTTLPTWRVGFEMRASRSTCPRTRVRVLGPHPDDLREDLLEHRAGVDRVDPETSELGFGSRAADSEVVATLAHDVQDGPHLGGACGMVEGWWEQPDAVSDPDRLRVLGDGGQEDLGRGGQGIALQEVVLDLPDMVEPELVRQTS
jgi:hypothetical protein